MFDVSAAVRQALASEPAYLLPALAPRRATRHWPRYAIGGALAASVALATVVGIRQWQAPGAADQLAAATPDNASTLPVVAIGDAPTAVTAPQPSRLESYWAAHADNALLAGQDSLNPLLRNVSIDSQR
jgi:negative regulator of sigma E activity